MVSFPLTKGFADNRRRLDHYGDHASDFGATSEIHYEHMADCRNINTGTKF